MPSGDAARAAISKIEEDRMRQYGPIQETMSAAVEAFNTLFRKEMSVVDAYRFMAILKLAREGYSIDPDNIVDAIGYLSGMAEYIDMEYTRAGVR